MPAGFPSRLNCSVGRVASSQSSKNFELGPRGPVAAEDLVGADGRCSAPAPAERPQAASPGRRPPGRLSRGRLGRDADGASFR